MQGSTVQRIAHKIVQQDERGESTVIFIGAGASVSAGIPATSGLIDHIKNKKEFKPFINSDSSDYFEIMGDLDPGDRRRVLNNFIKRSKINITHLVISVLIKRGLVDCVVTTNFDPLLKKALSLLNCNYQTYDIANNINLAGSKLFFPAIFYLHGEYRNVWQFNTKSELSKKSDEIKSVINKIGTRRTWIVAGYSGDDPVFDHLKKFEKFDESLFWIGFEEEDPIKKVKNSLLNIYSKNSYHIPGFRSDSFFTELFYEIQNLHSLEWTEVFKGLQLSLRGHKQFEEKLDASIAQTHELTTNCEDWVNRMILDKTIQSEPREISHTIWGIISNKFSDLFRVDHYSKVKRYVSNDYPTEAESGIKNKNYSSALKAAKKYIKKNPNSPLGYYYKGVALGAQGQAKESPEEANSYFKKMEKAFSKAQELVSGMEEKPDEVNRINAIEKSIWRTEHNSAVKYASDDSVMKTVEKPYEVSLTHLDNALLIQPEDILSLGVYAQVSGMSGKYKQAAEAQKKYITLNDSTTAKQQMLLAQYYRNSDQPQKAISTLEKAREKYPENTQLIEILADSYSEVGKSEKAISMVGDLVEKNPLNTQYLLSLGTQIYQAALETQNNSDYDENVEKITILQQKLRDASSAEKQEIQNKIDKLKAKNDKLLQKMDEQANQAIEKLQTVANEDPGSVKAYNTLGIIYQNKAAVYFDQRNTTQSSKKAAEMDSKAKEKLKKAMCNYEKATELDSDNYKYWRSLYQVYLALGMDEKARKAREKANY